MNKQLLVSIAAAVGFVATATAVAAPLPTGTKLGIVSGVGSGAGVPCSSGSCFGMEVGPGLYFWTDINPGTDGGFILGKAQQSGGQELALSATNSTTGELSAAWYFGTAYGTFSTTPDSTSNVFDGASCAGATCLGKTDLKVFNIAWNGMAIPMGSAGGCVLASCSIDQSNGIFVADYQMNPAGVWSIDYSQVVPVGPFQGTKFRTIIRGAVTVNSMPTAASLNISGAYGLTINWMPVVNDPNGNLLTCRIGTPPENGVATVANNCSSGTYKADVGFIGIDSFTYIPSNTGGDGPAGMVTAAITAPSTSSACIDQYPTSQISVLGKRGHLRVTFTGNIVSADKEYIKICPTTVLSYMAATDTANATVVCKVKSSVAGNSGNMKVNDLLKCSDKPVGNDKVNIKVKSGIRQRS